ncbi:MAG TPA: VWA domain-containing protein [Thermoanaerobaculia bacterium]|nr:VWA domain-containing protein [Thermoanaerobaculia bacterium]
MRRIAVLSLLFVVVATAQDLPRLGEVMEVSIVNLEVVVTDRQGNRVQGLTKDDFEIREGGKAQPITNFAEYRGAERDAERARVEGSAAPAAPRPQRTLLIAVESQRLEPFRRDEFFAALHKFVDDVMGPGDQAMVLSLRPLAPMKVRQAMTTDRAAIQAALAKVAKEFGLEPADQADAARQEIAEREALNEEAERVPVRTMIPGEVCALQQMVGIRRKANAVGGLMDSMGALEGRKMLLLTTRRFGYNAGVECGAEAWEFKTNRIREQLIESANANGFTIYALNPATSRPQLASADRRGPDGDMGVSQAVLLNEYVSMAEIAEQTGGGAEVGPDVVKLLPLIARDLDSYYSIGYRGDAKKMDRARNVSVTVKRKDLRVRTRAQVVEKSDATRMKDRVTAALSYVADPGTITPTVKSGAVRRQSRNRFTLPITVEVPIGQLITVAEGSSHRGAFSLFVGGGNKEILFSDVTQRTQILTIPDADLARAKQAHYTYDVDLTIDGKVNRIAVGVYDEVGHEYGVVRVDVKAQEP